MITSLPLVGVSVILLATTAVLTSPDSAAQAPGDWVAVASSPSREALDWAIQGGPLAAQTAALAQCAALQHPYDCRILASGPNCVAVAWDADEPLNRPHAAAADTPADALTAAIAAAGPLANDPEVRCSYLNSAAPQNSPPPQIA